MGRHIELVNTEQTRQGSCREGDDFRESKEQRRRYDTVCVCTCVCARVDTCGQLKTGALVSHCELLLSASQTVNDANLTARY